MILKTDCKHFPGDRPCIPNKTKGIKCNTCREYSPITFKILIIKLDAPGDVLRTTSLLPSLKKKYPDSFISWLTRESSKDLFKNNPLINQLLIFENADTISRLLVEEFDLLIHPDASPVSSPLASLVKTKEKKGFVLNSHGRVVAINKEAEDWFEMGAFDEFKKKNEKTYQQIIHEIAGLEYKKSKIQLFLGKEEVEFKNEFEKKFELGKHKYLVGLNTGASKRWQYKKWRLDGYIELIQELSNRKDVGVLLYGGPEEEESNKILMRKFPFLIDTGTRNSFRKFFALLDLADVLVTGDTMALHAATALGKKIVCLFGPTSPAEIEDYGLIQKVLPDLNCLVCYKQTCDFVPSCMDKISARMVLDAIENAIKEVKNR
ncbi:MAG: glycosyltransferase family 9 protein [Ignavibacteriales bacterium]|nr:glycosyltransferase family 9 protein [Ignavibacteriales bacterium]